MLVGSRVWVQLDLKLRLVRSLNPVVAMLFDRVEVVEVEVVMWFWSVSGAESGVLLRSAARR